MANRDYFLSDFNRFNRFHIDQRIPNTGQLEPLRIFADSMTVKAGQERIAIIVADRVANGHHRYKTLAAIHVFDHSDTLTDKLTQGVALAGLFRFVQIQDSTDQKTVCIVRNGEAVHVLTSFVLMRRS